METDTADPTRKHKLEDLERELEAASLARRDATSLEAKPKGSRGFGTVRLAAGPSAGGSLASLLLGLVMAAAGAYLIANQVLVTSGYWWWWGPNTFGLTLIPLVIGVGLLFYDGKSVPGWVLAGGGAAIIFVGILANLQIFFRPTSLFNTLLMLVLFVAGLGLLARGLLPSRRA